MPLLRCVTVHDDSRELGFNQQALYCYGKVHSLDPSNLNALWDRAALAKEIDDNRTVSILLLRVSAV
jgi:general transcription factor 3C polypeptide 3 (transcription factor C subunit 4)